MLFYANMCKFIKIFIISIGLLLGDIVNSYSQNIETISSTVEFVVNTNNFIANENYTRYVDEIVPIIKENSNNIDYILLIGSASPEGNKQANIRLANIRADRIYSYIKTYVPKSKIIINNNYELFLDKTRLDESDYTKLRATYIEVHFKQSPKIETRTDTVYKEKEKIDTVYIDNIIRDTVKIEKTDTVYASMKNDDKLVFSVYNSLTEDLIQRPNIGVEFYFYQMSWFIDGSFSSGTFYGKKYDIDFWHTGLRKYFNDRYDKLYIELYGRTGWYDTDLFSKDDNGVFGIFFGCGLGLGYKFSVCKHWKITPNIRFGFDNFKFNDYYYFDGNGGIDVSFGKYVDGRNPSKEVNNDVQTVNKDGNTVYLNDKTINRDFFNNSYNMYWFGPTYIGVTIQRDFYIHK